MHQRLTLLKDTLLKAAEKGIQITKEYVMSLVDQLKLDPQLRDLISTALDIAGLIPQGLVEAHVYFIYAVGELAIISIAQTEHNRINRVNYDNSPDRYWRMGKPTPQREFFMPGNSWDEAYNSVACAKPSCILKP